MLDLADGRRRHRSGKTCRNVLTTETAELSDSLELPSNSFCHFEIYCGNATAEIRITVPLLTHSVKKKFTSGVNARLRQYHLCDWRRAKCLSCMHLRCDGVTCGTGRMFITDARDLLRHRKTEHLARGLFRELQHLARIGVTVGRIGAADASVVSLECR